MQSKSGTIGALQGDKLKQALRENQKWVKALVYLSVGLVMANSSLFDTISPFGAAFCAALSGTSSIAAALGIVLGYILSPPAMGMKYIAAVMLIAAAKWMLTGNRSVGANKALAQKRDAAASVVIVFLAMLVANAAVVFSDGYTLYDLILTFSEMMLACGAAYFFTRASKLLEHGWSGASKADISCAVVSFAIIVTGFAGLEIRGMSVGRVLSVLAILLAARYGGESAGSVAGIICGIAMSLSGGDFGYVVAAYAFGGLISGVFSGMGRIAAASSFIAVNAIVSFLTQETSALYISLFETFVASVVFVAVPSSLISRLRPVRTTSTDGSYARGILRDRLNDVAAALSDIGSTTRKVGQELGKIETSGEYEIAPKVVDRVCRRCSMKNTCWQFSYNDTRDAVNAAVGTLKRNGSINRSKLPRYLASNCTRIDDMVTELNSQFQAYISREGVSRKVSQVRSVLTDQFESLAMMLTEFSQELGEYKSFDEAKARRVRELFEKEGIDAKRIAVFTDENDRVNVMFVIPNYQIAKLNRSKAALDLCTLLETDFDLPQITARKQSATVVFAEKTMFTVEFGAYQIAGGGNKLCGDAYDFIKNRNGKSHFILSDGMGSGGSAAVDSSMASSLTAQLIGTGVSHDAALKLVNSALMVKSGEESLATLDVASIDLYTGKADFYKAGAAPTYLIKNGKAGYVESSSLPAGILRNVSFEHNVASLRENDIIVMLSDGVTATGSDWIKTELEYLKSGDVQRMCERLASTAKSRRKDNHEDDITVLAVALHRVG